MWGPIPLFTISKLVIASWPNQAGKQNSFSFSLSPSPTKKDEDHVRVESVPNRTYSRGEEEEEEEERGQYLSHYRWSEGTWWCPFWRQIFWRFMMESHFSFTHILILSRDRRLEKIESKDGWAVADKIDHFFNEVDVVGFVSSGVVHVVGLVQCPCCYCWWWWQQGQRWPGDCQVHRREEEAAQEAAERIRRAEMRRRPPWFVHYHSQKMVVRVVMVMRNAKRICWN